MPLDGHGLVPLIAQVVGVPLAVFLNAFPEGGEVVVLPSRYSRTAFLLPMRRRVAYLWAGLASSS